MAKKTRLFHLSSWSLESVTLYVWKTFSRSFLSKIKFWNWELLPRDNRYQQQICDKVSNELAFADSSIGGKWNWNVNVDVEVTKFMVDFTVPSPVHSDEKEIKFLNWWIQVCSRYPTIFKLITAILSIFHWPQVEGTFS